MELPLPRSVSRIALLFCFTWYRARSSTSFIYAGKEFFFQRPIHDELHCSTFVLINHHRPTILSVPVSKNLMKTNYPMWRTQVLPAIRVAQLEDLLTGDDVAPAKTIVVTNINKTTTSTTNPAYTSWVARDQAILGYLLSSLTRETHMHVSHCNTAAHAWSTLANLYSFQKRAHSVNTRIALTTTRKNQLFVSDYYAKMSQLADDHAAPGAPLHDDEFVAYLLAGLDEDYNSVFTSVVACAGAIAPTELYAQLLSFEHHTSLQGNSAHDGSLSAMTASHDCGFSVDHGSGPSSRGRGRGCGRTRRGGFSNQSGRDTDNSSNSSTNRPQCQVCSKFGHTAKTCWYRYEYDSTIESHTACLTSSSDVGNSWYTNSDATDHITRYLDNLTMHDTNGGHDQIHAANGSSMNIAHICTSIIPTPTRSLALNNVLHIPSTHKNLISIHRFTLDNDTFIEFHPYFFLIKDQKMRKILLHG
jgi:hypothetical protein